MLNKNWISEVFSFQMQLEILQKCIFVFPKLFVLCFVIYFKYEIKVQILSFLMFNAWLKCLLLADVKNYIYRNIFYLSLAELSQT